MASRTKRINVFTESLNVNKDNDTTSAYGVENGHSVKIPIPKIREGLATDEALREQGEDFTSDQQRQDKALADYKIAVTSDQQRQDNALTDFKQEYTTKQTEQDGKIAQVEQSISTAHFVPWSGNLDEIPTSEREGKIYQNWGTNDKYQHGGFYEWVATAETIDGLTIIEDGEAREYTIMNDEPEVNIYTTNRVTDNAPSAIFYDTNRNWKSNRITIGGYSFSISRIDIDNGVIKMQTGVADNTINKNIKARIFAYSNGLYVIYFESDGNKYLSKFQILNVCPSIKVISEDEAKNITTHYSKAYEWHRVDVDTPFDPSGITADLSALTNRVGTAETSIANLSAKWTEILFSQIDADHQTLGTLNTYLSEAKRTSIDNAISKSHTQNTDIMLNNGTLKVESNKISATLPIVSSGDIEGVGTDNKHHLLSKKMDSAMLRTYNSFDAMVADKANIPQGAWCAIIE